MRGEDVTDRTNAFLLLEGDDDLLRLTAIIRLDCGVAKHEKGSITKELDASEAPKAAPGSGARRKGEVRPHIFADFCDKLQVGTFGSFVFSFRGIRRSKQSSLVNLPSCRAQKGAGPFSVRSASRRFELSLAEIRAHQDVRCLAGRTEEAGTSTSKWKCSTSC